MMFEIWMAFITGLTTGGLSCMAVQGGLLASSLANQLEKDMQASLRMRKGKNKAKPVLKPQIAAPILLFLLSKLVAYTLLGFLLGILGSMLQLTPMMRAILQFAIGIFMIGNALRMFNIHPIFRYFSFEPPAWLTRYLRKTAKNQTSFITPIFLGALTVFIPCGVTQAVMAAALGSGSPIFGAAILFAFILGTSPVFFGLAYFATRLGAKLEKHFMRIVAVIVLLLGIFAIDTGLNLAGSPLSLTKAARAVLGSLAAEVVQEGGSPVVPTLAAQADGEVITLYVENYGYKPETLPAPADTALTLNLVTKNTRSCARAFVIPELNLEEILPETGTVSLQIPQQPAGKVIYFSCSMGMYGGKIIFQ